MKILDIIKATRKKPAGHKGYIRRTPTGKIAQVKEKPYVKEDKITFHDPKRTGHLHNIAIKRINVNGKPADVTYYEHPTNPEEHGAELYMGKNYIVGSNDRSFSRNYKQLKGLPKGLESHVNELKNAHKKEYGSKKEDGLKTLLQHKTRLESQLKDIVTGKDLTFPLGSTEARINQMSIEDVLYDIKKEITKLQSKRGEDTKTIGENMDKSHKKILSIIKAAKTKIKQKRHMRTRAGKPYLAGTEWYSFNRKLKEMPLLEEESPEEVKEAEREVAEKYGKRARYNKSKNAEVK